MVLNRQRAGHKRWIGGGVRAVAALADPIRAVSTEPRIPLVRIFAPFDRDCPRQP